MTAAPQAPSGPSQSSRRSHSYFWAHSKPYNLSGHAQTAGDALKGLRMVGGTTDPVYLFAEGADGIHLLTVDEARRYGGSEATGINFAQHTEQVMVSSSAEVESWVIHHRS